MENEVHLTQTLPQTPTPVSSPTSHNWSKIILFTVLGLAIVVSSTFAGIQIGKNQSLNQKLAAEQPTNTTQAMVSSTTLPTMPSSDNKTDGVKFTGNIIETNNGCWSDGTCSIKVDDKWITTEIGGLRPPNSKPEIRGRLMGINFSQDMGKRVEVYAKQIDDNYFTIYGNENYYIKLLE